MAKARRSRGSLFIVWSAGLLALLVGGAWCVRSREARLARTAMTQRSTAAPRGRGVVAGMGVTAPAALTITVTDDRGPLGSAMVRLAPRAGEIVVVITAADGVAHAERLEPGSWQVSASAEGHIPATLPVRELAAGGVEQLALRLASGGRTLHGKVSDTSGGPVAGARIEAAELTAAGTPDDAVSTTFTSDDGTYHMTVAEGSFVVAATSADYASQIRRIEVGPAGAVANFALVPGGVIEGVVLDERTHEPVGGASVRARRNPGVMFSAERRVLAGPDGRFRITGLKPGDWQLDAFAPPRFSRDPTHVGLAVAEQVSGVELQIGASPVIRGRVVDETGAAAPGVQLHAVGYGTGSTATADPGGEFVMQGLPPGGYTISAESSAYLRIRGTSVWLADQDVDGVVVCVQRGLAVKGHVEPRQPCHVQPEFGRASGRSSHAVADVSTGPDGEFVVGPFDGGSTRLVARCASGDEGSVQVEVVPGLPDAVIRVKPGGALGGRVVDRDGTPVPGVSVVANPAAVMTALDSGLVGVPLHMAGGMITTGERALTDAGGAFQINGLPAGVYGFQVLDRGKPLRPLGPSPEATLAAGEHREGIALAVEPAGGVISGTVTDPDGAPLADAWVSVYPQLSALDVMNIGTIDAPVMNLGPGGNDPAPPPALTDAQGHFELTGLFQVKYTVIAEGRRGQLRARQADIVPGTTLQLQTHGVSTLVGTVTGPAGPVAVFSAALRGPTVADHSVTQGKFAFDHINPGSYTVYVESLVGGGVGQATVAPGATATLDITLAVNGTVTGTLVDPTGKPARGMEVVVVRADEQGGEMIRPPVTTEVDGRFRIEHAPGPCHVVVFRRPARPFVKRGFVVESGKTVELGAIVLDAPTAPPTPPASPRTPAGNAMPSSTPRRAPAESSRATARR